MTPPSFHRLVGEYLTARRGLGFDLETAEGYLRNFASHADRIGHSGPVTIELAVQWARSSRSTNPAQAARRLAVVRQFARYRALFDPATEVPPAGLLGRIPRRSTPHIYTEAEMAALLQQASCLLPRHGLRPVTYVAYFALLASTGLRLSVGKTFRRIRWRLDWTGHGRTRQPRIHDLRHYSGIRIIPSRLRVDGGSLVVSTC